MTKGARQLAKLFAGPTQSQVARKLGIDRSTMSLLVSGKRKPTLTLAARIKRELGIPIEFWAE